MCAVTFNISEQKTEQLTILHSAHCMLWHLRNVWDLTIWLAICNKIVELIRETSEKKIQSDEPNYSNCGQFISSKSQSFCCHLHPTALFSIFYFSNTSESEIFRLSDLFFLEIKWISCNNNLFKMSTCSFVLMVLERFMFDCNCYNDQLFNEFYNRKLCISYFIGLNDANNYTTIHFNRRYSTKQITREKMHCHETWK